MPTQRVDTPPVVSRMWQEFAACSVFFLGGVLCVMRGRVSREERVAWWLFALAMTIWGVASVCLFVLLAASVGDVLCLASYPSAYVALILLMRKRVGSAGKECLDRRSRGRPGCRGCGRGAGFSERSGRHARTGDGGGLLGDPCRRSRSAGTGRGGDDGSGVEGVRCLAPVGACVCDLRDWRQYLSGQGRGGHLCCWWHRGHHLADRGPAGRPCRVAG